MNYREAASTGVINDARTDDARTNDARTAESPANRACRTIRRGVTPCRGVIQSRPYASRPYASRPYADRMPARFPGDGEGLL